MENKKEKIDYIKNEPENLDDYFTDFYEACFNTLSIHSDIG